ncbi:MAG: purine-nucleoside phosphorylase [bacterium]
MSLYQEVQTAAEFLTRQGFGQPCVALIFGSGLGAIAQRMEVENEVPYSQIPGFVNTTLSFHKGRLLWGNMKGVPAVAMDGRFHRYEGWDMKKITFPVRVMRALGADTLILSNIAGGLNPHFLAGDLAIIVDHINLMGDNPLIGPNDDRLGPRFPDMKESYNKKLIECAERVAMNKGIRIYRAVYAALTGPSFETPAEYRMLRILGADLVGMSSVPEVIVANHSGMKVCGLSVISDLCFPDCLEPLDVTVLLERAEKGAEKIGEIVEGLLDILKEELWKTI